MQAYDQQTLFLQPLKSSFLKQDRFQRTVKFQIDKNLSLQLVLKETKNSVIFQGKILHSDEFELKLHPKFWKLVSEYSQLKISNLLFLYDFYDQSVNITSKISFSPKLGLNDKFIQQHSKNILRHVKSFASSLYRYRIVKFSPNFYFKQFWQESKLKRKLALQLRQTKPVEKIPQFHALVESSDMIDEKEESKSHSNIEKCRIEVCDLDEVDDLPRQLQGGPNNVKLHFRNKSGSWIISGGFFEIEKLLCRFQKKLQISDKSNPKTVGQYGPVTESKIQGQNFLFQQTYDILVRKTLKQVKKQLASNRLKISKELTIVQQIKNKTHLLTYYKNTWNPNPKGYFSLPEPISQQNEQKMLELMALNNSKNSMERKRQFIYETEIYMEFHAHTLHDLICKPNKSLEESLDACGQLLEAAAHLHESGVIHRDIKPENILIDYNSSKKNQVVKLIDFSESAIHIGAKMNPNIPKEAIREMKEAISQIFEKHNPRLYGATLPYSPPQCQSDRQTRESSGVNNFKIDSWSVGMILPEIYHGKRFVNFPKPYADDIINVIRDSGFEVFNSRVDKRGFEMVESLITYMGTKNIFYKQELRLDVTRCYCAFQMLTEEYGKWRKTIRQEGSKHSFQYSKA